MKKCPSCYAIMRESAKPTPVALRQNPNNGTLEVSKLRVRYECSQCGHTEESFAMPVPRSTIRVA
jgi:hypothetical protein